MVAALRLLCWEGYHTAPLLSAFEARHGIQVCAETLLSDAGTAERLAAGEVDRWDVLNINNAYVRDYLHPRGLIEPLDESRIEHRARGDLAGFERPYVWTRDSESRLIGVSQRFGPFNLVVNTDRVSVPMAEDQGFALAADRSNHGRYGILEYDDFNLFHICIAAAFVDGTCNPVTQMEDPKVFNAFSPRQLEAIQWDSLAEDLAACVDYQLMPEHDTLLESLQRVRALS